jgi:two-component system sensor histidine kinase HydH
VEPTFLLETYWHLNCIPTFMMNPDHAISAHTPFKPSTEAAPQHTHAMRVWSAAILGPVVVVIALWVIMSVATNIYLRWVESEYDRLFSENLSTIRTAEFLESTIWKTVAGLTDPTLDPDQRAERLKDSQQVLRGLLEGLLTTAVTDKEKITSAQLQDAVDQFCRLMETEITIRRTTLQANMDMIQQLTAKAAIVAGHAESIRTINDQLIQTAVDRMAWSRNRVLLARILLLILGPIVGLYLGWRVARRLRSTVAEIAVTLSESGNSGTPAEMTVSITRESTFEDVRRQAERVVDRLKRVGEELQTARREVIQSERLAAVGELAAGVAHEMRNPLTSVKLLLQHASRQPETFRLSGSQFQLILKEIGRMESTIQGLLDFSRRPMLNRVRHDLRDTLSRSMNLVDGRLRQGRIELITAISQDPLWFDGDSEQLNQVFVNLLLNSIEAMEDGGQLHVAARRGSRETVEVIVQDSGTGIAPEVAARLFEPFTTTKERGTGLGLAISHRIVTEHGGSIHVSSQSQQGTRFVVELPLSLPEGAIGHHGKTADY